MTSRAQAGRGEDDVIPDAGSGSDQHITGSTETGDFITDKEPAADTPAHGSGNTGVNPEDTDPADHIDDPGGRSASAQ
jgi:hypothetical protein